MRGKGKGCIRTNMKEPFSEHQRGRLGHRKKEESSPFKGQERKVQSIASLVLERIFFHSSRM
jgi:hypothetical protein